MRILLTVSMLLVSILSFAETYFKEGTKWVMESVPSANGKPVVYSWSEVELVGSYDVDGFKCSKLTERYDATQEFRELGYVRTDGEKVYFKPIDSDDAKWYLMYDFGLKEGDTCVVYQIFAGVNQPIKTEPLSIKCVGFETEDNWEVMLIEDHLQHLDLIRPGKWLLGAGSMDNVIHPAYGDFVGGGGYRLVELIYDGEVIYSQPRNTNGISNICNQVDIKVSGNLCRIINFPVQTEIRVVDIEGREILSCNADSESFEFTLPSAGIYLLKVGEISYKIII